MHSPWRCCNAISHQLQRILVIVVVIIVVAVAVVVRRVADRQLVVVIIVARSERKDSAPGVLDAARLDEAHDSHLPDD
jgi:hypothetical protein